MNTFKTFHSTKLNDEDIEKEKTCMMNIRKSVSQKCGISNFIDYDDFTVAFSGSKENMELVLEIYTQKYEGKKYLYASLDDDVSWPEWDFNSCADFEEDIAEYISHRVNKTIKTIVEVDKSKLSVTSFYLDDNGEWVCFENECTDSKGICYLMSKITKSTEIIKTYKLDI